MRRGWVLLYLNTPTSEVVLCGPNWGRLNTERAAVAFAIRRWACNRRKRKRPSGPRLEGSQTVYASMQVPTAVVVGAAAAAADTDATAAAANIDAVVVLLPVVVDAAAAVVAAIVVRCHEYHI